MVGRKTLITKGKGKLYYKLARGPVLRNVCSLVSRCLLVMFSMCLGLLDLHVHLLEPSAVSSYKNKLLM